MGLGDKIENAAEKAGGKGKEAAGAATGDESLRAEGQADQAMGDLKQAGEKVMDAFKKDGPERDRGGCIPWDAPSSVLTHGLFFVRVIFRPGYFSSGPRSGPGTN